MSSNHKKYFKYIDPIAKLFPKFIAKPTYCIFKNVGGGIGFIVRYICIKKIAIECGANVAVFPGCVLKHIDKMRIGSNVSIHTMCYFDAIGGISIGNDVSIAHSTSLVSFNHTWKDPQTPIKYNPSVFESIIIEDDVWIGCGCSCRILAGVRIGERCVVAAGAVVNKDIERNSLYAGVPAKKIKTI